MRTNWLTLIAALLFVNQLLVSCYQQFKRGDSQVTFIYSIALPTGHIALLEKNDAGKPQYTRLNFDFEVLNGPIELDASTVTNRLKIFLRPAGDLLAVWYGPDQDITGVYGRICSYEGICGTLVQLNQQQTTGYQVFHDGFVNADNSAIVTWRSAFNAGNKYIQKMSSTLGMVGTPVQILTNAVEEIRYAVLASGDVAMVYRGSANNFVQVKIVDSDVNDVKSPVNVQPHPTTGVDPNPQIVAHPDGVHFFVVRVYSPDGSSMYLKAHKYDSNLNLLDTVDLQSLSYADYEISYSISPPIITSDGRLVVSWLQGPSGNQDAKARAVNIDDFSDLSEIWPISQGAERDNVDVSFPLENPITGDLSLSYLSTGSDGKKLQTRQFCGSTFCVPYLSPICSGSGQCDPCTSDSACSFFPEYPTCLLGRCLDIIDFEKAEGDEIEEELCTFGEISFNIDSTISNPIFQPSIVSNDATFKANLETYLESFGHLAPSFTIPENLLLPDLPFLIEVQTILASSIEVVLSAGKTFTFDPIGEITSTPIDQVFTYDFDVVNCFPSQAYSYSWSQLSGVTFDISLYAIANEDRQISIPACTIPSGFHEFAYEISFTSNPAIINSFVLDIEVTGSVTTIISGTTTTEAYRSISMSAEFDSICPITDLEFSWSCEYRSQDSNDYQPCSDPDSIFDVYSASPDIELDPSQVLPYTIIKLIATSKTTTDQNDSEEYLIEVDPQFKVTLAEPQFRCYQGVYVDYTEITGQNAKFSWSIEGNPPNKTKYGKLTSFFTKQVDDYIGISFELFDAGYEYTIIGNKIVDGQIIQTNQTTFNHIPQNLKVRFDGGDDQFLHYQYENVIRAQAPCIPGGVEFEWKQVSGPDLELQTLINEDIPTWIEIPACHMKKNTVYEIDIIFKNNVDDIEFSNLITITTSDDMIDGRILRGNQFYSHDQDISLKALVQFRGECPINLNDFQFTWSCKIENRAALTWNNCPNEANLFGQQYEGNNELTIPSQDFEAGSYVWITVEADNSISSVELNTYLSITTAKQTSIIEFDCQTTGLDNLFSLPCYVYSPQRSHKITADNNDLLYTNQLLMWNTNPNLPKAYFENLLKMIPLERILNEQEKQLSEFEAIFFIQNETHKQNARFTLPLNFAPESGSLIISPNEGTAMITYFTIETSGWTDPDLPLQYQYSIGRIDDEGEEEVDLTSFTQITKSTIIERFLFISHSDEINRQGIVKVDAYDFYFAKNSATVDIIVKSEFQSLQDSIILMNNLINDVNKITDPINRIEELTMIMQQFEEIDKRQVAQLGSKAVCECEHGFCLNSQCVCDVGFTLNNCDMKLKELNVLEDSKLKAMKILQENLKYSQNIEYILSLIEDQTSNPILNTDKTMKRAKELLDYVIDLENGGLALSKESSETLSSIVNNLLEYAGESDCRNEKPFTRELEADIELYLGKIASGLSSTQLPGEDFVFANETQFSVWTKIFTSCTISSVEQLTGFASNTKFKIEPSNNHQPKDCSREQLLSIYSFNENLFNCSETWRNQISPPSANTTIDMIRITDADTGRDLSELYQIVFVDPYDGFCDSSCDLDKLINYCYCDFSTPIFDVKGQIDRIFENSNIDKLLNIDVSEWRLYDSLPLWSIILLSIFSGITLRLIKKKFKDNCIVKDMEGKSQLPMPTILKILFIINHPYLNILYLNHAPVSKRMRIFIFYARVLMMQTVLLLLGTQSGVSIGGEERLLKSIDVSLDIWVLLIPYVTFVAAEVLLRALLSEVDPNKKQPLTIKKQRIKKVLRFIGISLMILFVLASIVVSLIVSEGNTIEENLEWLALFARALAQDWIITPFILLALTIAVQDDNVVAVLKMKKKEAKKASKPLPSIKKNKIVPLDSEAALQTEIQETETELVPKPPKINTNKYEKTPNIGGVHKETIDEKLSQEEDDDNSESQSGQAQETTEKVSKSSSCIQEEVKLPDPDSQKQNNNNQEQAQNPTLVVQGSQQSLDMRLDLEENKIIEEKQVQSKDCFVSPTGKITLIDLDNFVQRGDKIKKETKTFVELIKGFSFNDLKQVQNSDCNDNPQAKIQKLGDDAEKGIKTVALE